MLSTECGRPGVNRKLCSSSHSETKPPSGGSPALASTPTSVIQATQGMLRISPPSLPRLRSEVACSTDAGAEEQQALEEGVAGDVVQAGGERQRRHRLHVVGREDDGEADAGQQHADVLDRRVGEQPLHVDLHRGEDDAEQGRGQAQRQQHAAPPPQLQVQQVEDDAQQAVDRGLQHHAAHQRRDGRGRRRVRLGQPDMQWQDAGLGAEAEHRQPERGRGPEWRQRLRPHVGEGVVAGIGLQHAEAHQDADRAHVRHQQVEIAGTPDLGDAVVGRDEEERGQRHRLPHHHEGVGVVGQHHADHAGEKDVVLQAQQARWRALALAEVAGGEGRDAGSGGADHHQEEGREAVQAQMEGQRRQADRQHGHLGATEHRARRHAEQQHADRAAGWKQDAGNEAEAAQREHPGQTHQQPGRDHDQHPVDVQPVRHRFRRRAALRRCRSALGGAAAASALAPLGTNEAPWCAR